MNKFVITGATSFLGKHIIKKLIEDDVQVFAIIRPSSKHVSDFDNEPKVKTILSDMDDTEKWVKEIVEADYFIHLGWDGIGSNGRSDVQIQQKNIETAVNVFKAAFRIHCKAFLFAGSQAEYGIKDEIITEDMVCNPVTQYGKAKLEVLNNALTLINDLNMHYYHARIFSVYGYGDHEWTLVSTCIENLCNDKEVNLSSCEQFWNYIEVKDAVHQIISLLISSAESGVYNIASKDTRPLKSFVEEIYDICGKRGKMNFNCYQPAERPAELKPSIKKLENAIGEMQYCTFREGITQLVNQYELESD